LAAATFCPEQPLIRFRAEITARIDIGVEPGRIVSQNRGLKSQSHYRRSISQPCSNLQIVCGLHRLYIASPAGSANESWWNIEREDRQMEGVIAKLLQDFEQGKMNRRQLIQSLSLAAVASAAAAPAAIAAGKPLEALYVNHISYSVNDYKKVRDFYVDLLGMKITEDDGKQCRLVFGNNILIPRNRASGPAKVDHIAYTVTNWDAEKEGIEEELKRRNLQYTGSAKTSFQVKDPEGMGVQFGGLHQ
jgi:catechol 2,3-dioxygenase-like lactoylglutathione lyase family enzyme